MSRVKRGKIKQKRRELLSTKGFAGDANQERAAKKRFFTPGLTLLQDANRKSAITAPLKCPHQCSYQSERNDL